MSETREAYDGNRIGGVTQQDILEGKVKPGRYPARKPCPVAEEYCCDPSGRRCMAPKIDLAEEVVGTLESFGKRLEALAARLTEAENAIPALRLNRPATAPAPIQEFSSGNPREDFLRKAILGFTARLDAMEASSERVVKWEILLEMQKSISVRDEALDLCHQDMERLSKENVEMAATIADLREKWEAKSLDTSYWGAWIACTDALGDLWKPKKNENGQDCAVRLIRELKQKASNHE